MPKISAKFKWGANRDGVGYKIGDFRPIAISQKRNANRNTYVLHSVVLFAVTLIDPNYLKPPYFRHFCITFHIFIVGGDTDFKFGR